jgi:hypothetical protein
MTTHKMTEADFLAEVLALCAANPDLYPLRTDPAKFNQREAANKGFPDLVIFGPGGALFRELKTMDGMGPGHGLRPDQAKWKHVLLGGGHDWDFWTPADLASGRIDDELQDVATPDEHSDEFSLAMLRDPA